VFIEATDNGGGGDSWSYRSCKAPVKSSPPTNQHFFTGRLPFLSPKQQCQSTEGKITSYGLAYPQLTWGLPSLSLTCFNNRCLLTAKKDTIF